VNDDIEAALGKLCSAHNRLGQRMEVERQQRSRWRRWLGFPVAVMSPCPIDEGDACRTAYIELRDAIETAIARGV
jgi:hypothetical protein